MPPQSLKHWDELKFDRWYETICKDSTMQYLYAKAGLKQPKQGKHISVSEGCPYTAYPKDQRYILQTQNKKDIAAICQVQKRVAAHWKGVADICSCLVQAHLVNGALLPEECIKKRNVIATVYHMLNHWTNHPVPVIPLSNRTYSPISNGFYRLTIPEDACKTRNKCVLT
jgi:hypothetical protein